MATFKALVLVLLISQTTHIKLEPKDCILLVKSLGIQFTPQLFSTVSIPNKVRYTSTNNSHKYKPSLEEIRSQKPKMSVVFLLVASFKARFWGQRRSLQRRNDGIKELATTMEASEEEDEPEELTTTTEALAEESEEATRPSESLQRRRRWCVYGPRELTTTTAASARGLSDNDKGISSGRRIHDAPEGLETTPEAAGDQ